MSSSFVSNLKSSSASCSSVAARANHVNSMRLVIDTSGRITPT
jgi:hypothetical protein